MEPHEIKKGTPVTYYSTILASGKKLGAKETHITSEPWKLGHGEIVCKVEGVSGGVSIKHLFPRP